jgi:hypothetical protein
VHGLIAQSPSGAWTAGGAILTFVIPMVLFIVVAIGLYILYTKPSIVPGRRHPNADHPVSYTAVPGRPVASQVADNPASTPRDPAAAPGNPGTARGSEATGSGRARGFRRRKASKGKKAETEDGE